MMYSENDISNSIKNGILYLEDPVNHVRARSGQAWGGAPWEKASIHGPHFCLSQEWYPHYFVLTSSKIYYSEETSNDQGNEDEEEPKEVRGQAQGWGLGGGQSHRVSLLSPSPHRPVAAQSCTPVRSGSTGSSGQDGMGGT